MSTKSTTTPPTDDPPSILGFLRRIATAVEAVAQSLASPNVDPEVRCFTVEEAADILGVSPNWIREHMDDQSVPFTYIGKFRRMRLKHIRAVAEANEIDPKRRGHKTLTAA